MRLFVSLAAVAAAAACGEHAGPTAPASQSSTIALSHAPPPPPKPPKHATQEQQPGKGPKVAVCHIPYDIWVSARIGPSGGTLDLGDNNIIVFPPGAVLTTTTITAHVPAGDSAKVFFTPEGLHFAVPAVVTLNYSSCITPSSLLSIVYLQADTVSEVELSQSNPKSQTVTATINHFSSYAVAY